MNLESYWAQIEQEQTWRMDEIRFFDNQSSKVGASEQNKFRRANILMLYAHYEGFCKFMLTLYVQAINGERLKCSEASYALTAATLDKLFHEFRTPDSKAVEFKNSAPDDKKLHIFARNIKWSRRKAL